MYSTPAAYATRPSLWKTKRCLTSKSKRIARCCWKNIVLKVEPTQMTVSHPLFNYYHNCGTRPRVFSGNKKALHLVMCTFPRLSHSGHRV